MKIAVVGVTGLVGSVMCDVLEERNFPVSTFLPVASEKSVGKTISFKGNDYKVVGLQDAVEARPDIALFSAGGSVSKEWAPKFEAVGTVVIDNSSAWRMDANCPLVVPEVNAHVLKGNEGIIANPNCSTIQMVVALDPLHKAYRMKRLVISTYQSITGTGVKAVRQFESEKNGNPLNVEEQAYPHSIFNNCIPHCDVFLENDYTKEEMKLVHETRKIMDIPELNVTATAVRVPVHGGHSESINIEFEKDFDILEVKKLLSSAPGLTLVDDIRHNMYPMPLDAHNKDGVFVGRVRRDESHPNSLNIWVVADNLRKGAATNTIQIAEYLAANNLIKKSSSISAG